MDVQSNARLSRRKYTFLFVGMISSFFVLILVLVLADSLGYFNVPTYFFLMLPLSFLFAFLYVVYFVRRSNVRRWIGRWNRLLSGPGPAGIANVKTKPRLFGMYGTPKLIGTYNAVPFEVENALEKTSPSRWTFYYRLTMTPGERGKGWKAEYGGLGRPSWRIETEGDKWLTQDRALKQRLIDSGVITALQSWPEYPTVAWDAKKGSLRYITKVGGH